MNEDHEVWKVVRVGHRVIDFLQHPALRLDIDTLRA